eukprot:scaffold8730_cov83-Skeletonema_menzelii.AAC.2
MKDWWRWNEISRYHGRQFAEASPVREILESKFFGGAGGSPRLKNVDKKMRYVSIRYHLFWKIKATSRRDALLTQGHLEGL